MSIVYGPVRSWRLGCSLGIDPICRDPKVCSYNCVYCQLGGRGITTTTKCRFVRTEDLSWELRSIKAKRIDVVTFSGTGEPMLASNLREMGETIKARFDSPIALLTNSCHFSSEDAMDALEPFDIVVAKLDAPTEDVFKKVNRPCSSVSFDQVLEGIHKIREEFSGSFRLQLMFLDVNQNEAESLADLCREIGPDMVYINTPLRPCGVTPLETNEIEEISSYFSGMKVEKVYDRNRSG